MTTKRPNFFILLGLNPDLPWNQTQFENAVRQKRNEWSRQSAGVGSQALAAKQNLAFITEIERVMNNLAERENEAQEARKELASGRKARYDQFEKQLLFINVKDSIDEAEINKFVDDFKDILTVKDIKDRIKVRIKKPGAASPKQQRLDETEARHIAKLLEVLHLNSLYELLRCPHTTSSPLLCKAAETLYTEMVGRPPSAETTAKSELAGLAKRIFASEDMRKRYDETLRQVSLDRLLKELDAIMNRSTDKKVHPNQVNLFLANALKESWTEQEALDSLTNHGQKRKWSVPLPMINPDAPRRTCPNCEELTESKQLYCTNCKKPLFIECPRCKQQVSSNFRECGNCSFPVGDRFIIDDYLREIEELRKKHDLQRIDILLQEIEMGWPANNNDERTRKRIEFRRVVDDEKKQQRNFIDILDQLIKEKKFFTASERITKRKLPTFSDLDIRQQNIARQIKRAQDLIHIVLTENRSQEDKIELCRQALVLCVDYKDAQDLLRKMPPSRPGALRASIHGTVVRLSWDFSPTQGVVYKIMRKSGAQPNALTDGVLLDTVTGQVYDDTAPEKGLSLYYAVFAELDTIISANAAYLAQPIMVVQDATKFFSEVHDGSVTLSWEPPPYVHTIIITRKEQSPPSSLSDGTRLAHTSPTQKILKDARVQNERTYYYSLYCQFKDTNGTLYTSDGVCISARPEIPPTPIADEDVSINETLLDTGRKVEISWKKPAKKGDVIIFKSAQSLHTHKQVLPEAQLQALGQKLEGHGNRATDIWTAFGIAYYTPVVIFQQTAYVGISRRYACLENVSNLQAQNLGSAIRLQWTWPRDCREVIIAYHESDYPDLNAPDIKKYPSCTRAEYDQRGHYDIQGPSNQKYYIVVAAIIEQDGEKFPALGTRIEAQLRLKTDLTYKIIINTSFLRRRCTLHITTNRSKSLPTLLLISKLNGLPMDQHDGDRLKCIEPPILTKNELVIDLSDDVLKLPPQTFGMLFLEDYDTFHHEFNIYHPSKDKLRLS